MKVAVMSTCIGDAMFPDAVRATVRLLRRLGVSVEVPEAQTCCGQPMVNTGYVDEAVPLVRTFVSSRRAAGMPRSRMPWPAPPRAPWS